ncbi:MAG TPA: cupin domain-containing protein [Terracidiphilus sp.]|nr:cupin domain-containing protein [Terracidiphilus sp.]
MNRRELFAALAATVVAGEMPVLAQTNSGAEAAPQSPTGPVMGSTVWAWNAMVAKPTPTGSVRSVCSAPTATLENLEIHISTLNPGLESHKPHKHPNEELIIVRQGTVETLSNGQWIRVGPGSVIFNGSNQVHCFRNVGADQAIYHVVNFKTAATPPGKTEFVDVK